MSDLLSLIRPEISELRAYDADQRDFASDALFLDANENPWPPFGPLGALCPLNRYADPQPAALVARVSELYGPTPEQIVLTRGSDEAIDLLIRLFCRAGQDNILVCPPTFVMYETYAAIQGARTLHVPLLPDRQLDLHGILAAATDETKLIFVPTPNAPTGRAMNKDDLLALCAARAGKSIIVADEAYAEFLPAPEGCLPALGRVPNLVVLRTLSKAHALAGERMGLTFAPAWLAQNLHKIRAPYPLTQTSIRAAMDALSPQGIALMKEHLALLLAERDRVAALLPTSPLVKSVEPTVTNFFLIEPTDMKLFMTALDGIRAFARPGVSGLKDRVRLALGTSEQNDRVLSALRVRI